MTTGTKKTTPFSGINVAYTTYNLDSRSPSQPVLCLIHGWCCTAAMWSGQAPLYTRHPSILIDLPGHGESEKPDAPVYSVENFARSIHAVLEAEGIAKVVLIGHSMGGYISTMYLRLYGQEAVKGVIYVSSFWALPAHTFNAEQRRGMAKMCEDDDVAMTLFESSWNTKSTPAIREQVREILFRQTPMHVRTGCILGEVPHMWNWDEVFGDTPMLQITYHDAPEWDGQARRHLPNLKTEKWPDVSIFLFMEDPEKFNDRVERFLQEYHL